MKRIKVIEDGETVKSIEELIAPKTYPYRSAENLAALIAATLINDLVYKKDHKLTIFEDYQNEQEDLKVVNSELVLDSLQRCIPKEILTH